jgi:hypothetical protein
MAAFRRANCPFEDPHAERDHKPIRTSCRTSDYERTAAYELVGLPLLSVNCRGLGLPGGPLGCVDGLRVCVDIWPREETVERFVKHPGTVQHLDSGQV